MSNCCEYAVDGGFCSGLPISGSRCPYSERMVESRTNYLLGIRNGDDWRACGCRQVLLRLREESVAENNELELACA